MHKPTRESRSRLFVALLFICLGFTVLITRLGYLQLVRGEELRIMALRQQTRDVPINAKRGTIYDRNGKELAVSISLFSVWATPNEITNPEVVATELSQILSLDKQKIYDKISDKKKGYVRVEKWIDKEKSLEIAAAKLKGIKVAPNYKRYYPYGNFAPHVIGLTTDDNQGLGGVELKYNKVLSGLPGRWIKSADGKGRELAYGVEKYYEPTNGLNVVLTIDEVIQNYTEKAIENGLAATNAKRIMAIALDPQTGDVLSMAVKPDFDPNDPRVPLDENLKAEYDGMTSKEKSALWNKMWRNPMISDTYEPGSTFKLITSAAGLEENVVEPDSPFYSKGYSLVGGHTIKCWRHYRPHGQQTFTEGVQNSCNPVFIEVAQRLGIEKYYKYLESFGFKEKTGIDLPGEGGSIVYSKSVAGPVELATMSFGHGISVTPIQLVSAFGAIANDGKFMKPRIVKELTDNDGEVIHRYEPKFIRQVISEKTSKELRLIMESVVTEGSGYRAYVAGYRVGGKTGTADKIVDGKYSSGKVYSSFVGIAPVDNPKLVVLVVIDEPQGVHYGSQTAAPIVYEIMRDSMRQLEVEPQYNEEEKEKFFRADIKVPEVRNMKLKDSAKLLDELNLDFATEPTNVTSKELTVIDQFPKPGSVVKENSKVILFLEVGVVKD